MRRRRCNSGVAAATAASPLQMRRRTALLGPSFEGAAAARAETVTALWTRRHWGGSGPRLPRRPGRELLRIESNGRCGSARSIRIDSDRLGQTRTDSDSSEYNRRLQAVEPPAVAGTRSVRARGGNGRGGAGRARARGGGRERWRDGPVWAVLGGRRRRRSAWAAGPAGRGCDQGPPLGYSHATKVLTKDRPWLCSGRRSRRRRRRRRRHSTRALQTRARETAQSLRPLSRSEPWL